MGSLVDGRPGDRSGYTFRYLAVGELALMNDLYNRCHHADRSMAEAQWLYKKHAYGEAIILGAFTADNALAGVLPAIPHKFVRGGHEESGCQLVDAVVAPEHRNRGLFGHLVKLVCEMAEQRNLTVFAFPNDQSLSVYRKTGLLQSIGACETRVKVLSWPKYVRYKLGLTGGESGEQTPPGDAASLSDGDVSLVPVSRFDVDFEELHEEMARVVVEFALRRRDFLNWRYFGSTQKHYQVALIMRAERALGYVVVRVINRIAHVIDVFVEPDRLVARKTASLVTGWARRMGAIAVYFSTTKGNFVQHAFRRVGFLLTKKGAEVVQDPKSLGRLTALHHRGVAFGDFYFVMGDGDFY